MPSKRVVIEVEFTADLDMVPGWGHEPQDWVDLIENALNVNKHYNTETKILNVATVE